MADRTVSVKLRAEVAQYMASMRTAGKATTDLEKASKQLQVAFDNEEDAAGRVRVAEAQLADAQKSGKASATQLARAQEQLATAQRKYARAQDDTIVATQRYESVQNSVGESMDETVEKFDESSRDIDKIAKRTQFQFRALAVAIAAAAPAIGAAAIGVAATAAAASFIGLGAVALRESERVTDAWSSLGTELKSGAAADATVLEQSFVDAAANIGTAYEDMRPQMRAAFADSVPLVETLTDGVIDLAQNALPGMTRAVAEGGPAIQGMANLLADTGTGLSGLFDEVANHSESAGLGISHLGDLMAGTLPELGGILGNLSDLWAEHGDIAVEVINQLMSVLDNLTGGALPVFGTVLGAALQVLSSVLDTLEPISGILGAGIGVWLSYAGAIRAVTAIGGGIRALTQRVRGLGDATGGLSRGATVAGAALAGISLAAQATLGGIGEFNVAASEMVTGLEKFAQTGRASGEAARLFGEDLSGLGDALDLVTQGGFIGWTKEFSEGVANVFGAQGELGDAREQIESLDRALASMVQNNDSAGALSTLQKAASAAGVSVGELRAQLPTFQSALDSAGVSGSNLTARTAELNAALSRSGDEYERAKTKLEEYLNQQRAATDPVFALQNAVQQVGEAQKAYNQAVTQYGEKSPQASEAAWTLAEAVSGAEQAALNGDLSFSNFRGKLQQWVNQGVLTQRQADTLAGRVKNLRGEANDYRGDYAATLHANTRQAADNLSSVKSQLDGLDGRVATSYHRLMRTVTTTTGSGSNTGLYNFDWRDGGKIEGFAGGGKITGPGTGTSDSIPGFAEGAPIRVSNGEFISTAASTARNESALAAGNRGATLVALGSTGGTQMVTRAPHTAGVTYVTAQFSFPHYVGNRAELMTELRKTIRNLYGGDVSRALGKGAA